MMNTKKIIKISLADEVANSIRQEIIEDKLKPNDQLPTEAELTRSFGVGRSTLREAVKILVHSGLIRVQQGVGMFVEENRGIKEPFSQRLQRVDNEDLDEVRKLLEMKIAEKAAMKRTKADLQKMKQALELRKKRADRNDLSGCVDADIEFHSAIAGASKNDILSELYRTLSIHLKKWFVELYSDTDIFKETQRLHEQLLESITQQDAKKAWNAAARIIDK
ncbi:MAG: FCD domain-containing protein [Agriterribacter sp.]